MKDEFNNINIKNPDGELKDFEFSGSKPFDNEISSYIKENPLDEQEETYKPNESYNDPLGGEPEGEEGINSEIDLTSTLSTTSTQTATASVLATEASTVASATTIVGSGIGAFVGAVAASVVTAVMVVAAFMSTLSINLSLLMATTNSLAVELKMTGAQDEDFATPMMAVLRHEDEVIQEIEVWSDTKIVTFENLESNTEYLVSIENEEMSFARKSFITLKEEVDKGRIIVWNEGSSVYIRVEDVKLDPGEYYTIISKDSDGKKVFAKDSIEADVTYQFEVSNSGTINTTYSVSGKTYDLNEIEVIFDASYDFENGVWTWSEDNESAFITFKELNGEGTIDIDATVEKSYFEPSCENDGYTLYSATAIYDGRSFFTEDTVTDSGSALGHVFSDLVEETIADCENDGVEAHYYCSRCNKYFDSEHNETTLEALTILAYGHDFGELINEVEATYDENGMKAHYICSRCGKYFDSNFNETTKEALIIKALGHDFSDLIAELDATCEADGMKAHYICNDCGKYYDTEYNETTIEALTIKAYGHDFGELVAQNDATCDKDGMAAHYHCDRCGKYFDANHNETTLEALTIASAGHNFGELVAEVAASCEVDGMKAHYHCDSCGKYFDSDYNEVSVEDLTIAALGHDYGDSTFEWITDQDGFYISSTLVLVCSHDEEHRIEIEAELDVDETPPTCETNAEMFYKATAEYEGEEYFDEKLVTIPDSALGHEYGEAVFEWTTGPNSEYTGAVLRFYCIHDSSHYIEEEAEVFSEEYDADCETDAYTVYTAAASYEQEEYYDEKVVYHDNTALGHEYGTPIFDWEKSGNTFIATAIFTCTNNSQHQMELEAEVTSVESTYTAHVSYNNEDYYDTKVAYIVYFYTDGGSGMDPTDLLEGMTIEEYVPTKDGYVFGGWYSNNDLTEYIGDVPITGDTDAYASWVLPLDYSLNLDGESYSVVGLGDYTGNALEIPNEYLGIPVTRIADYAFSSTNLVEAFMSYNITYIGEGAFSNCSSLSYVSVSDGVTYIGANAFSGTVISSMYIPDTVTVINENTFSGCSNMTEITLPGTLTAINSPFASCTSLTTIYYEGTTDSWQTLVGQSSGWLSGLTQPITVSCNDGSLNYNN